VALVSVAPVLALVWAPAPVSEPVLELAPELVWALVLVLALAPVSEPVQVLAPA
jgi:hypothetical protein